MAIEICTEFADHAAPQEDDHQQHDRTLRDQRPFAEAREVVVQHDDDPGADHRAGERAEAAQQGHQDNLARDRPGYVGQRRELEYGGFHAAGKPCHRGGQHEGD